MRPSRRASQAPCLQTPVLPGPSCTHCERPLSLYPAYFRCAEPICGGLPLCVDCFSVGAHDVYPHLPTHPYRVIERVYESLYAKDWAAHEEERLLHVLCDRGPNHWREVADYVSSKSQIKCERHYQEVYMDGEMAPLPTEVIERDNVPEPSSPAPVSEGKRTASANKAEEGEERTVKPGVKAGVLEGYMPLRGDFDVEWDDDAENVVADLVIASGDTPEEVRLKLRLLEIYDYRLKRRDAVKQILFDHNLLDFGSHRVGGSRTARDEKELAARLKVFSRLLEKNVYNSVQESVTNIYKLSRDVYRLAQARELGVHRLSEVDIYDVERKARATKLTETSNVPGKSTGKRRASSSSAVPPAKRTKRRDGPCVSAPHGKGVTFPTIGENLHLVYSPTPEVAGLPPGVNLHDVLAEDAVQNSATNDTGAVVEARLQSKTAQLRRAREQRRMMKSTYPQVEAMDVTTMPGTTELTESELVLCSSLRLPPEEFLALRDAMLCAFSDDMVPPATIESESANGQITTMRATKLRTQAANGDNNEKVHIQVTHTPLKRSVTATAAQFKEGDNGEKIKPSCHNRTRITRSSGVINHSTINGAQPSATVQISNVEVEREKRQSPAQAGTLNRVANGVSVATPVEQSLQHHEDLRGYNVDCNIISIEGPKSTHISTVNDSRIGSENRNTNMYSGTTRHWNTVNSTLGDYSEANQDVADIVAECIGQSGVRLTLSVHLPNSNELLPPNARKYHAVKVFIDIDNKSRNIERLARPVTTKKVNASSQFGVAQVSGVEALHNLGRSEMTESRHGSEGKGVSDEASTWNFFGEKDKVMSPELRLGRHVELTTRTKRGRGRRSIRARSRGQTRSAARTRLVSGRARRTTRRKAENPASAVAPEPKVIVIDDRLSEENAAVRTSPVECTKSRFGAKDFASSGVEGAGLVRVDSTGSRPGTTTFFSNGITRKGLDETHRNKSGFDGFTSGVVQEEVLDGGNADSMGRRGADNVAEVESNAMQNVSGSPNVTKFANNSVESKDKDFLYIAPARENAVHIQRIDQSPQLSESGESDVGNEADTGGQNSGHEHYSESESPPESLSAEDDADPSVDFSLAEDASEDDDDFVDIEKPVDVTRRVRRGRRTITDSTRKRVSNRNQNRKRGATGSNPASESANRRETRASNEDEAWGPESAIHVPPSAKKPPLTPMRKSVRRKSGAAMDEVTPTTKMLKTNRYSLRRRG